MPDPVEGEVQKPAVTNSTITAIDFDKATEVYAKSLGKVHPPSSVDALYQHDNGELFFIEFKSSKPSGNELKWKAVEGLLTFIELTEIKRSCIRESMTFMVVYNYNGNENSGETPKEKLRSLQQIRGGQHPSRGLSLGRLRHLYFKDVKAMTGSEFASYIAEHNWKSMV